MLDFFSWMKRLQQQGGVQQWTIWDASGFYIVNKTPKRRLEALNGDRSGEKILEVLVTEQDSPKREEIRRNCDARRQYLKRLIEIADIDAVYIDSRDIFRQDPRYAVALDIALEYVGRLERDNPSLVRKIVPPSENPATALYLPLEIAEAVYFEDTAGISGKFGPKTEQFFDACILGAQEEMKRPYMAIWSPLGPRKPGYLFDEQALWTSSRDKDVLAAFQDTGYDYFARRYLNTFCQAGEFAKDCMLRLKRELAEVKS